MPLKKSDDGSLVVQDGLPVWIHPVTKAEAPFDPDRAHADNVDLGRESKTYREAKETLEATLSALKIAGVNPDDPTAISEALKELKKLKHQGNDGDDPPDTAALRATVHELEEALEALQGRETEASKNLQAEQGKVRRLTVSERFKRSRHFSRWTDENGEPREPLTILPPEVAEAYFGSFFEPGDGSEIHGYYKPGGDKAQLIYSRAEGESKPAQFDEAIDRLLERMPNKNELLPPSNTKGAKSQESDGPGGGKMTPKQVDSMPHDKYSAMREKGQFPDKP